MTVCIAMRGLTYAGSQGIDPKPKERIITICDRMLSYPDFLVDDAAFKRVTVHPRWRAMFSGDDIGPVTPLTRIVQGTYRREKDIWKKWRTLFATHFMNIRIFWP